MTMKTFRTEEEARKAGVQYFGKDLWMKPTPDGGNVLHARILSPETLKCVEALEASEWVDFNDGFGAACPCCDEGKEHGHAPNCKLDLALKAVGVR